MVGLYYSIVSLYHYLEEKALYLFFLFIFRRLSLYPNGDRKRSGNDHMSLYLLMVDPPTSGIIVNVKFFVYDHLRDNFLTIQGVLYLTLQFLFSTFP